MSMILGSGASTTYSEAQARVVGDPGECLGAKGGNGGIFSVARRRASGDHGAGGGLNAVDGAGERRRGRRRAQNLAEGGGLMEGGLVTRGRGLHT